MPDNASANAGRSLDTSISQRCIRLTAASARHNIAPMSRPFLLRITFAACLLGFAVSAYAQHPFLCCDYNGGKVCIVSAEGKIEWQYECKNPQDCWKLPNGNILFCFKSGALELTPDKKIVWEYK